MSPDGIPKQLTALAKEKIDKWYNEDEMRPMAIKNKLAKKGKYLSVHFVHFVQFF